MSIALQYSFHPCLARTAPWPGESAPPCFANRGGAHLNTQAASTLPVEMSLAEPHLAANTMAPSLHSGPAAPVEFALAYCSPSHPLSPRWWLVIACCTTQGRVLLTCCRSKIGSVSDSCNGLLCHPEQHQSGHLLHAVSVKPKTGSGSHQQHNRSGCLHGHGPLTASEDQGTTTKWIKCKASQQPS